MIYELPCKPFIPNERRCICENPPLMESQRLIYNYYCDSFCLVVYECTNHTCYLEDDVIEAVGYDAVSYGDGLYHHFYLVNDFDKWYYCSDVYALNFYFSQHYFGTLNTPFLDGLFREHNSLTFHFCAEKDPSNVNFYFSFSASSVLDFYINLNLALQAFKKKFSYKLSSVTSDFFCFNDEDLEIIEFELFL